MGPGRCTCWVHKHCTPILQQASRFGAQLTGSRVSRSTIVIGLPSRWGIWHRIASTPVPQPAPPSTHQDFYFVAQSACPPPSHQTCNCKIRLRDRCSLQRQNHTTNAKNPCWPLGQRAPDCGCSVLDAYSVDSVVVPRQPIATPDRRCGAHLGHGGPPFGRDGCQVPCPMPAPGSICRPVSHQIIPSQLTKLSDVLASQSYRSSQQTIYFK